MKTRFFVNYIDPDEIQALRKTEHSRPIGRTEDGEDIMSHLGTIVQQYVGLASKPDQDVIDNPPTIIGISRRKRGWQGEVWIMSRPLYPAWIKPLTELDLTIPGCKREFVAGEEKRASWHSFYAESNCYAIADLRLTKDGRRLKELPPEELENLFAEVEFDDFRFDPEGSIGSLEKRDEFFKSSPTEVEFDTLCFCINCECLIHQDNVANGECWECGCPEPEHPAYEGADYNCIFEEFF